MIIGLALSAWAMAAGVLVAVIGRVCDEQPVAAAPWNDDWRLWAAGL